MDSIKLIFAFTLILLVGFSISFSQALGVGGLPWVAAAWIGWFGGVAWVRGHRW